MSETVTYADQGTPLDELVPALARFQAEMPVVAKTKRATVRSNQGASFTYTYAGLAEISTAAFPLLAKNGLCFTTLPGAGELVGMLLHSSGQALVGRLPIRGNTPQQVGSELTYARRYLLGCMTGLVTDDDDDGQLAQAGARTGEDSPAPARKTVRTRKARQAAEATASVVELPPDPGEGNQTQEAAREIPVRLPAGPGSPPQAQQVPPDEQPPEYKPITAPQRARLMISCSRVGIDPSTDRTMRLALFSALLARPILSSADLSYTDANTLLRYLNDIETKALEWDYILPDNTVRLRWADK